MTRPPGERPGEPDRLADQLDLRRQVRLPTDGDADRTDPRAGPAPWSPARGCRVAEPGRFTDMAGPSAGELPLRAYPHGSGT
ncbi:hypothetical protein [Streptomyces sp. cmx-4-9]|uniref:hypothetical protein n=1 Tax=Streptomyces sp. cmx-4-9 TaxID=2790941 RepID=UPI003980053A